MHNRRRNIITTLISQFVTTACGVLTPHIMISVFGSAVYGLTTSIAQFLSYITLLEGGITSVARAELYRPLADKDRSGISSVYHAMKHFFSIVGIAFLAYTLIISLTYYDIAQVTEVGRGYIFLLVWVISLSTIAKYLVGLSDLTLLVADQKQYVMNIIVTTATVVNVLLVVILAKAGCSLLAVKIGSSIVFVAQPVGYALYVRKHYKLPFVGKNRARLKQKWTGMGQHFAYFIHRNTDVVILTLFADLRLVAVYSVYRLVISSIRNIAGSFASGMEAALGELIAKKEKKTLQTAFFQYKHLLSFMSVVLFGTTAVLIVPFVRLYTKGIRDVNYIQPMFAAVLLLAEAIDCFMTPCVSMPVAANKLKETKWGAYGEAVINIVLSLILVQWSPLLGIALATLIATVFKALFYMIYGAKNILQVKAGVLLRNFLLTNGLICLFVAVGFVLMKESLITNYIQWALWGCVVFGGVSIVTAAVYFVFYPAELKAVLASVLRKIKRR